MGVGDWRAATATATAARARKAGRGAPLKPIHNSPYGRSLKHPRHKRRRHRLKRPAAHHRDVGRTTRQRRRRTAASRAFGGRGRRRRGRRRRLEHVHYGLVDLTLRGGGGERTGADARARTLGAVLVSRLNFFLTPAPGSMAARCGGFEGVRGRASRVAALAGRVRLVHGLRAVVGVEVGQGVCALGMWLAASSWSTAGGLGVAAY